MSTENLVLKATHSAGNIPSSSVVNVSAEAERYAREHSLLDSLIVVKSLILRDAAFIKSVDVDLVRDPEAEAGFVICFSIQTIASVPDILEFDKGLRNSFFDAISADERASFAVRFDFD